MVSAKYIKENEFWSGKYNDRQKNEPEIEVIKINNNNKEYEKYANKTHEITVKDKSNRG